MFGAHNRRSFLPGLRSILKQRSGGKRHGSLKSMALDTALMTLDTAFMALDTADGASYQASQLWFLLLRPDRRWAIALDCWGTDLENR